MGSMNSNNWLSFPLSPTHSSQPAYLQTTQSHQFSLGVVNDGMEIPFQNHDWNLLNTHSSTGTEVPKVADFLGVSKSENQSDLVAYNEIQPNDTDYLFSSSNSILPVQNSVVGATSTNYEFNENANSNLQSLTLSMGSASGNKGSTCETSGDTSTNSTVEAAAPRRTLDTFGQRTSIYRGVTRHRWTGRYEAHLWDNTCRREGQSRKGRQGGYDKEEKAARAYDLAALKYWGTSTTTNFPITNYEKELEEMKHMTRQEFVASIRRKSSGFSRGASMYRGVTRHHQHGRWQARIGRVAGNKDLYLGTFTTEEEAAEAYDIAAIKFRGLNAVTNFDMTRYDVKSILESNTLPIGGGAAKRLKEAQAIESSRKREEMIALSSSFQYGNSSSSSRLQPYPLNLMHLQQQQFDPQPLLTLQNQQDMSSQYSSHDPSSFNQSYLQTQLQLHQQSNPHQYYNSYLHQNHPALIQGLMNMQGSSSGVIDINNNNGSSSTAGSYISSGGFLGMGSNNSTSVGGVGGGNVPEELQMVKVDYDIPSGGYGGWSGDHSSVQGSNPASGVFTMWNDQ
ncbi:AP2-like ethylene-responsive transcription factor [Quillaja saponaria]|uniref:AP2-like ethylene-responsive transcription factor n=1 Tax=Quillaja saponaria TaxID=32244 RepID=A0AAD7KWV3_QUISA|nr:AP2-like ethylene-responsive transcription factor [Quillaja saponaria]